MSDSGTEGAIIEETKDSSQPEEYKLPYCYVPIKPSRIPKDPPESAGVYISKFWKWVSLLTVNLDSIENEVYSWGRGSDGELGNGKTQTVTRPFQIPKLRKMSISGFVAGNKMSLFVNRNGEVYEAGRVHDQAGAGSWEPKRVDSIRGIVGQLAAGFQGAYVVTVPGNVKTYLDYRLKQEKSKEEPKQEPMIEVPECEAQEVESPEVNVHGVDVEDKSEAVGRVYSWGSGSIGQLGHGDDKPVAAPKLISALTSHTVVQVTAGFRFALALTLDGQVFSWGKGSNGQLGHGSTENLFTPQLISGLKGYFVLSVSAGNSHVLALAEGCTTEGIRNKTVFGWGSNGDGRLSFDPEYTGDITLPTELEYFRTHNIEKISAGGDHSLVLCSAGVRSYVYAFGSNSYGQLGIDSFNNSFIPMYVKELGWMTVVAIEAGTRSSMAITATGEFYSWGEGTYGITCQENNRNTSAPWKSLDLLQQFMSAASLGKAHAICLFRKGVYDRSRSFSISPPDPSSKTNYLQTQGSYCYCPETHLLTEAPFSMYFSCVTCKIQVLCRCCIRRCHVGHEIDVFCYGLGTLECECDRENRLIGVKIVEE